MHIAILGLGPSLHDFIELTKGLGGPRAYCDQVWGINAVGAVIRCDLVFHMDDVRIQALRAEARPESNIARMLEWLAAERYVQVLTSRAHADYPSLFEYPLADVLSSCPGAAPYFNSTAAYACAYAIHAGASKISLYGCDYTYPDAHDAERGRACLEYWMGYAAARGIRLAMPKSSTLMDAIYSPAERLYGYDSLDVDLSADEHGRCVATMTPRDHLPSADEIEARYDHSAHPNAIVRAQSRRDDGTEQSE